MLTSQAHRYLPESWLQQLEAFFVEKGIKRAYLFGSWVRQQAGAASDLDLLVELDKPTGFAFFTYADELAQRIGRKVDLVTPGALKARVAAQVHAEKALIYEQREV
jgi:predicted nucleotidyltransferase